MEAVVAEPKPHKFNEASFRCDFCGCPVSDTSPVCHMRPEEPDKTGWSKPIDETTAADYRRGIDNLWSKNRGHFPL